MVRPSLAARLGWDVDNLGYDWNRFLSPEEIIALVARNGLVVEDKTGVVYHPLADEWRQSRDMGVNYMVLAAKA